MKTLRLDRVGEAGTRVLARKMLHAQEGRDEGPNRSPHRDEAFRSLLASVEEWVVPDVAVGA